MNSVAIVLNQLSRDFGSIRAVDGLTFSVPRGTVVGLLGHNGAGKTTTIRILNGLLAPTRGDARVLGLDPTVSGPEVRARTGVLTETPSLDERLTARENLAFAAQLFGVTAAAIATRVGELLERFELLNRADDQVAGFSRGMKQRLALARSLLHDPELLFLDEPTAALDPVASRDVHELIRSFAGQDGRTVVITTHNLVEAQRLCDRVVILRQGKSIADGTPSELSRRLSAAGHVEIEVGTGQAETAMAAVRAAVDGAQVRQDGEVLVVDGVGRDRLPGLIAGLAGAGVALYRVSPAEPSLEEAYFALHAQEAR